MNAVGPSCPAIHITQLLQNGVARGIIKELLCGQKHVRQLHSVAAPRSVKVQLKKLVALGLVAPKTIDAPDKELYALTPEGEAVRPIIRAIDLLDNHLFHEASQHNARLIN